MSYHSTNKLASYNLQLRGGILVLVFFDDSRQILTVINIFLCLRLLEKRRHYVIGLSERVKE